MTILPRLRPHRSGEGKDGRMGGWVDERCEGEAEGSEGGAVRVRVRARVRPRSITKTQTAARARAGRQAEGRGRGQELGTIKSETKKGEENTKKGGRRGLKKVIQQHEERRV